MDKKLNLVIGCELEVEIRCATIQAVERIRDKLNEKYAKSVNDACIAVTVDWRSASIAMMFPSCNVHKKGHICLNKRKGAAVKRAL